MDVRCQRCGEAWSSYFLRHEMWNDMGVRADAAGAGAEFNRTSTISEPVRDALEEVGWLFGATVFHIQRCPCCDDQGVDPSKPPVASAEIAALEGILDGDLDALASEIEDMQSIF